MLPYIPMYSTYCTRNNALCVVCIAPIECCGSMAQTKRLIPGGSLEKKHNLIHMKLGTSSHIGARPAIGVYYVQQKTKLET